MFPKVENGKLKWDGRSTTFECNANCVLKISNYDVISVLRTGFGGYRAGALDNGFGGYRVG